jgi:hypothetical protein
MARLGHNVQLRDTYVSEPNGAAQESNRPTGGLRRPAGVEATRSGQRLCELQDFAGSVLERRPTLAAIIVLGAALELVLQSYARGRDWTRTSAD